MLISARDLYNHPVQHLGEGINRFWTLPGDHVSVEIGVLALQPGRNVRGEGRSVKPRND